MDEIRYAGRTFSSSDIKSGNCYLAMSLLSDVLEINTLSFEVESGDRSLVDFQRNTPLLYSHDDSQIGVFYVQTVKRVGASTYSFYATSAIGLLDQVTHYGGIYTGQTVGELVTELCGDVPSVIKGNISGIKLYGWLPIATCRENLSQVLFAAGASVKTDLDGVLRIENLWDGVSGAVGRDRMFLGGKVEYAAAVSRVEVTEHQYAEGGESAKLFDGTTQSGDIITFSEPMYALTASGFTILDRGANYAKVSAGSGTLTGRKYIHNTRQVVKAVTSARSNGAESVRTVKDATLVSLVNSAAVAERLVNYYRCLETIQNDVVYRRERPGDLDVIYHPYDQEDVTACIQSADITLSRKLRAAERRLVGFVPPQIEQVVTYDHVEVITASGTWPIPEGVKNIRAVLIGGGQGGQAGKNGEAGTDGASCSSSNGGNATGEGGKGGAGGGSGSAGSGGKIFDVTLEIPDGVTQILLEIGAGGTGSTIPGQTGTAGDDTKVTVASKTYSSASGATSGVGYTELTTGQVFGKTGVAGKVGVAGGDGAKGASSATTGTNGQSISPYTGGPGGTGSYSEGGSVIHSYSQKELSSPVTVQNLGTFNVGYSFTGCIKQNCSFNTSTGTWTLGTKITRTLDDDTGFTWLYVGQETYNGVNYLIDNYYSSNYSGSGGTKTFRGSKRRGWQAVPNYGVAWGKGYGGAGGGGAAHSKNGNAANGKSGGSGASGTKPSPPTTPGTGGTGGNGGGGGGGGGGSYIVTHKNLTSQTTCNGGKGGEGGAGGPGGDGAPGCIILYYGVPKIVPTGALMDKDHRIIFDKFGRLIVA